MAVIIKSLTPSGEVAEREASIQTATSIVELTGSAATITAGARLVLDPNDLVLRGIKIDELSDEQLREVLLVRKGTPFHGLYEERNGVLRPANEATWTAATTYFNIEQIGVSG